MRQIVITVTALLISFTLVMTGISSLNSLVSIKAKYEGMNLITIGIIASTYYFGIMIGSLKTPKIVSNFGYIRSFAAFVAGISIMPLLHILAVNEVIWCIFRLICGFCVAGQFVVVESWLNERATNKTRASLLSIYMCMTHLAVILGQFLLYSGSISDFNVFAYTTILCVLSMVPLLLTKNTPPHIQSSTNVLQFTVLYKASPLAFLVVFVYGFNNAAFFSLSTIFMINMELKESIPILINAAILGALLFQFPIGKISDRIDRRIMLIILGFVASVACFFVFLNALGISDANAQQKFMSHILPFSFLYGLAGFSLYSVSSAHANDFATSEHRHQLAGALLMAFGFGSTLGPLIISFTMRYFGNASLFLVMSLIYSTIVIFAFYRMRFRKTVDIADRSTTLPVSSTLSANNVFINEIIQNQETNGVSDKKND